jgi:alpha-L-fucosidase
MIGKTHTKDWVVFAAVVGLMSVAPLYAQDALTAKPEAMQWWREARFGMFIHWGPVSLKGTEISWSRGGERRGTGGDPGPIPVEVYDNLYKEFNPTKFNAREWVALARAAGMKYLVFTSKHHDGFCMFDSALTDYKITNSPFKRDIVKELADACHEAGLRLGFYYSPPDWHHPDYRTENHARYIDYLHGHIRELCSNYGQLDVLWFDGLGGKAQDWDSEKLFPVVRSLQPNIIINNRAGLPADFDTPEQNVGAFQRERPWESCITIGRQWAWKPNDDIKSLRECIHTLVQCAGGDGNLLFNVGPMPTGEIEPRQADRLREIGAWLQKYGDAIYGTRGGPYMPGPWGASTCNGNAIYLHIFASPEKALTLPPLSTKITSHRVLTGGKAKVRQTKEGILITIPEHDRDAIDTIVELKVEARATDMPAIKTK